MIIPCAADKNTDHTHTTHQTNNHPFMVLLSYIILPIQPLSNHKMDATSYINWPFKINWGEFSIHQDSTSTT